MKTTNWITALVAGAAISTMAVVAVALIDAADGPRSAPVGAVTPPDTTVVPPPSVPPGGGARSAVDGTPVRTVTVSGEGTATVKPDTARVDLGVSVTAATAQAALAQAAEKANTLITSLKATGIAGDDIRTSGLSLYPRYDNAGSTITGYNVSNSVSATIRAIDDAGSVIDAATGFVGDAITIGGISFYVDDDAAALAAARDGAIADAKLRAGQYSSAAGASVGQVLTISEVISAGPQPLYFEAAAAADQSKASTPIQVGTQDLTVRVTVTYQLG